ncbi:MAG TPA: tetratricopeptide repeat protein [Thermoanaerobaculia bacterium]|nr:tetratricopeptide repeat protein [Thermoanaerobaculia bacterium]
MTKDNLLFATLGLMLGFISAYLTFEAMQARQPPRQLPGQAMQTAPGMPPGTPGAPGPGAPGMPGGAGAPSGDPNSSMAEIQRLRDYVAANPNDSEAVLTLANMNFEISNWGRARELYEQYLRLKPQSPDVMSDLGVALFNLGDHRAAIAQFHKAQSLAPDHWRSLYNEVIVLTFGLQDEAEADRVLKKLQQMQPGNPEVQRLATEIENRRNAA